MRKKIILSLGIIAAVAVIILLSVKITAHFVEREYRVEPWSHQKNLEITKFSVKKEDVKLSIFRNTFDVYIYIKGTINYDTLAQCLICEKNNINIDIGWNSLSTFFETKSSSNPEWII